MEDSKVQALYEKNKELSESEERYKCYIELSSEGIWRFEMDSKGGMDISLPPEEQVKIFFEKAVMAECNDSMARMYGFQNGKELTGIKLGNLLLQAKEQNIEMLLTFIKSGYKIIDAETIEKDNKGNFKYFLNNLTGIVKDGRLYGAWGTQRDITDRKKAEDAVMLMNDELSKKNEQLVKINNELDSFIFSVSHDLNSPLSNIEGLINVLKLNECYNQDDPKLMIDMMDVAIGRFKKTLRDITDIARSQVNAFSETKDEAMFHEVLEEVKYSIKNLISDTNAVLHEDFSSCEKVPFKKISLQSVLYNLISNAIKYRHPDRQPHIEICSRQENEFIVLEVKDNGIGIPKEQIAQVFTMFKRLHSHVEGTGVGLYIVRRIVENAGGKVKVESELGIGSSFKVYFKIF